jgi:hypothetical protein
VRCLPATRASFECASVQAAAFMVNANWDYSIPSCVFSRCLPYQEDQTMFPNPTRRA